MTFSLCARTATDAGPVYGIGIATDAPAVGALAPYVSEIGAVCTQAFVNVRLGRRGVDLLADVPIDAALDGLLAREEHASLRQLHGVAEPRDDVDTSAESELDSKFGVFAHTGEDCEEWCGHRTYPEDGLTVAGNMLTGPETLSAVADAFRTSDATDTPDGGVVPRLLDAIAAGTTAGGDKRGHSSAAICVKAPETTAYHDLRVDHHETPVIELRRVYEAAYEASDGFSETSKHRIFD